MPSKIRRGWNWLRRFRHRKGYGVHSPTDFYLITFVFYEAWAYYAYHPLHQLRKRRHSQAPCYREKTDKLLLRMANHLQPTWMMEIGTGSGIDTCYLAAGKQCPTLTIDETGTITEERTNLLSTFQQITPKTGDTLSILREVIVQNGLPPLIHLAHTEQYEACFEAMLPHVTPKTCIIVGKPYATAHKRKWWRAIVNDPRTGVTFDLYDIGIVFFDCKRIKEHRIVNFL